MSGRAIRSVAVLGGGAVGLSAALAFAHALPTARVEVIDTPPDPAALADRIPSTLPAVERFHARIGLEELDLVRRDIATHRLGTRFEKWSADGSPWTHVFGDYGLPAGAIGFHDLWLRARAAKAALPYDRYAAAALLGEAGRFVHPEEDPRSPLSTFRYALRLSPDGYRARLAEAAAAAGVAIGGGALGSIERRTDGGIAVLRLASGRTVEADLFLDCAGPSAPLLGALDPAFEDWSASLPVDRMLIGHAPSSAPPQPLDRAVATSAGWRWSIPLAGHRAFGLAFASDLTPESRARRILAAEDGGEAGETVAIRPGRRPRPWVSNVLALGDAATALDPLHGTNLSLAHGAIERAIELLPGRDCHPLELAEYNRRTAQETARVRDFLALHYLRSGRSKGEFWNGLDRRPLPESLQRTVEQFQARGRIPFFEEETFDRQAWVAALIGLGILPRQSNAMTGGVPAADAERGMRELAERLAALPDRLPPYSAYLARLLSR
jgi:tryptophan halogenase